jgi:hypothetical protein
MISTKSEGFPETPLDVQGADDNHETMKRETLTAILQSATGMKKEGDGFRAGDGTRFAFYLGEPGKAMVINDVQAVMLADDYLVVDAGVKGKLYLSYDAVHALAERDAAGARMGGGAVGFE